MTSPKIVLTGFMVRLIACVAVAVTGAWLERLGWERHAILALTAIGVALAGFARMWLRGRPLDPPRTAHRATAARA